MSDTFFVDPPFVAKYPGGMGRPARVALGGYVYHVLNRANARQRIFDHDEDYAAFEKVLRQAVERSAMRLLAYCIMPNHWHLVVWPHGDGDLSRFTGWLTLTHTQRWHAHRQTIGSGHLYQGRFKSFPVEDDGHFLTLCRYVERNALRANLVRSAEDWRWSSLWIRHHGNNEQQSMLAAWPVPRNPEWLQHVNEPLGEQEISALRRSVKRGNPYGSANWCDRTIRELRLENTVRPRGRPKKGS